MKGFTTTTAIPSRDLKIEALASISASFEVFCLASGVEALSEMMDHDAQTACGPRHVRGPSRHGCFTPHSSSGYPTRPVRIIVGSGPGSAIDIIACRQWLSKRLGQPTRTIKIVVPCQQRS